MFLQPAVLAKLPTYPNVGESVAYQLTGLFVVFSALGAIWIVMEIVGALFRRLSPAPSPPPSPPAPPATTPPAVALDPVLAAVIAAAVHHVINGPHRVVAIHPVITSDDWSLEGRRDIFISHRVR